MGRFDNIKGFTLCLATVMSVASIGKYIGQNSFTPLTDVSTASYAPTLFSIPSRTRLTEPNKSAVYSLADLYADEAEQRRVRAEYLAYLASMRPIFLAQRCTPLPQPPECYEVGLGIGQDRATNPQSLYTTEKSSSLTPTEKGQP